MGMNYDHIILEPEQKELFIRICEVVKTIPRDDRMDLIYAKYAVGGCLVIPSMKSGFTEFEDVHAADMDEFASKGLMRIRYSKNGTPNYNITPEGFLYYEWLMKQQGEPVERIEKHTRNYLDLDEFRKRYPRAYEHLMRAEEKLWASDSEKHFTVIGHECREAMQEFAADLYTQVLGSDLDVDKKNNIKRIRAVIDKKGSEKGETVKPFLDALLTYWGTLSDLVQRQEHGAQKEGEALTWEDARRLVFQTVNVMVELDRALGVKA